MLEFIETIKKGLLIEMENFLFSVLFVLLKIVIIHRNVMSVKNTQWLTLNLASPEAPKDRKNAEPCFLTKKLLSVSGMKKRDL